MPVDMALEDIPEYVQRKQRKVALLTAAYALTDAIRLDGDVDTAWRLLEALRGLS